MPFLSSFSGHTPDGFIESKRSVYVPTTGYSQSGKPYKDNWDVNRGIEDALEKVTWAYKAAYAIASNAARLSIDLRTENPRSGEIQKKTTVINLLNHKANDYQDAFTFRFMLSQQVLLSKKGAFVEVVRNKVGDVVSFNLLPPAITYPIPDPVKFVSGYVVELGAGQQRVLGPESVIWIKVPHATDPYKGQTPLDAAGLAIEYDYYSKIYNRNFVVNDNRPGGILVVNGEMGDVEAEEISRRFAGTTGSSIGGAGRTTVMSADAATWIDTSTSQRDAQYTEARQLNKDEILLAFGVPESILGNASGRTFANSDVEMDIFWRETMLPHLTLIERAFDRLDDDPNTFYSHDLSSVATLDRDSRERASYHLEELKQGAISIDEYRLLTGRNAVGINNLLVPTNLSPVVLQVDSSGVGTEPGDTAAGSRLNPAQRPGRPPKNPGKPSGTVTSDVDVSGRTSNGPAPIAVSPAPMSELALDIQETKEEENLAERRYRHIQRMERSVALQMGSMFKRQRRVIMEKASSRKIKDKWDAETKISATDVFDKDIWDSQFVEDANTWITSAVIDGMIEISGMGSINNPANQNNPEVLSIIEQRSARMALVNDTTKSIIDSVFEKTAGKSHADFISVLEETLTASTASRIATIARTEVSGSFNSGMMIAAKDAGFTRKSWVPLSDDGSRHNHASIENSIIDIDESFVIDGKSISYPGDINGVPDEIVNCRCTLRFS
jgi:HK97 family phage portal protein